MVIGLRNKGFYILSLIFVCISCKKNTQKFNNVVVQKTKNELHIDFFDKHYFSGYQLIIDESNLSDHPFFSYLNCNREGYFAVHFVPKSDSLISYWQDKYYANFNFNDFDNEVENTKISKKLKNNFKKYNIFCYCIKREYLEFKDGCTQESIYLKKNSYANIYLYDQDSKKWVLKKQIKNDLLPPYINNLFFINLFPKIFSIDNYKILKYTDTSTDDFLLNDKFSWFYNCNSSNSLSLEEKYFQITSPDRGFTIQAKFDKISPNYFNMKFNDAPLFPYPENMDWRNFSKDSIISNIQYVDNQIEFTWLGFYNTKTKKREFLENPFTGRVEQLPIILKKCDE
jgi:hypothetical protein